jgi:NADH-quinone oxidoreductase subunit L
MFRLIFTVFFSEARNGHEAKESSLVMTIPLLLLAILSATAGIVNSPWFYSVSGKSFGTFVYFDTPQIPEFNTSVAGTTTLVSLAGILIAWLIYQKKVIASEKIASTFKPLYLLLSNKYYIDELYGWLYNRIIVLAGRIFDWIDHVIVDGFFDGVAKSLRFSGGKMRYVQTGTLQNYALVIFLGVVLILVLFAVK